MVTLLLRLPKRQHNPNAQINQLCDSLNSYLSNLRQKSVNSAQIYYNLSELLSRRFDIMRFEALIQTYAALQLLTTNRKPLQ